MVVPVKQDGRPSFLNRAQGFLQRVRATVPAVQANQSVDFCGYKNSPDFFSLRRFSLSVLRNLRRSLRPMHSELREQVFQLLDRPSTPSGIRLQSL